MKYFQFFTITILVLLCLSASTFSVAQVATTMQWEQFVGPYGGVVTAITYAANGNVIIGTKNGGVFRSISNGTKWVRSNLTDVSVNALLLDASGNILAGTSNGMYHSFDHGNTWYKTSTGLTVEEVFSLAIDSQGLIYAGTKLGVFVSMDNGFNWRYKTINLRVHSLLVNPSDKVYAGTDFGIYQSTDYGETWFEVGLSSLTVMSLVRSESGKLFAGTLQDGIYSSQEDSLLWSQSGLASLSVNALALNPNGKLFAGTSLFGVFYSLDNGFMWYPSTFASGTVFALNSRKSNLLLAGSTIGVFLSGDEGNTWSKANTGLNVVTVKDVEVNEDGTLFIATEHQGVYRSTNKGTTWFESNNSLPAGTFNALAITSSGSIFAGHDYLGLYRSNDAGLNWVRTDSGLFGNTIQHIDSYLNNVYVATLESGLFASSDDGYLWRQINAPVGIFNIKALGISPSGGIFACYDTYGLFFSNDEGNTWMNRGTGLPELEVFSFGFDSVGTVYAGTGSVDGLFFSNNNGLNWNPTGFTKDVTSIATATNGNIFAATKGDGVFRSNDNGSSWTENNAGLFSLYLNDITVTSSGAVYVGVEGGGVYSSTYRLFGSISGTKFIDRNRNNYRDANEVGAPNWKIILREYIGTSTEPILINPDTAITDSNGNYSFSVVQDGKYVVSEFHVNGWVQTYPTGRGFYFISVQNHEAITGIDFGNVPAHSFTGNTGTNWSNPLNWQDGRLPSDTDAVEIPVDVVYDLPIPDSIHALRIASGGRITFSALAGRLRIRNSLQIDSNSTLAFPAGDSDATLFCEGDWVNNGIFDPGNSTIVFDGNNRKTIVNGSTSSSTAFGKQSPFAVRTSGGQFYNLTISGDSTYTDGNIIITNQLALQNNLFLSADDTLSLRKEVEDAITDTGMVPEGTIERYLNTTVPGTYRFESPKTTIEFSDTNNMPSSIMMTTYPGTFPDTATLWFEKINGTIDAVNNTITADSVSHFSKWVFGKPGTGFRKGTSDNPDYFHASASRYYVINSGGESGFKATINLRYEESELECELCEGEFSLGRGPYVIDSVYDKWNLVSVPLITESFDKNTLFPTSMSDAFSYNGGYVSNSELAFGSGYWLKFNGDQQLALIGDDVDSATIAVSEGWNLLGALSLPVDPSNITSSPEGIISGSFFGYRNGYYPAGELEPMQAYWVNVSEEGELTLNADGEAQAKISVLNELTQFNKLVISDANGNEQSLYFGDARQSNNRKFEMPPVPPQGIFDARFETNQMVEIAEANKTKEIPLRISSASYPLTISWKNKQANVSATLLVDGKERAMNERGSMQISEPASKISLKLSNGSSALPKEFALQQNYPNPFNPATVIRYQLPVNSLVTLKVYNILGQEVKVLLNNEEMVAGEHEALFDATQFSSGVYFYRIQAGQFSKTMKMLLTK